MTKQSAKVRWRKRVVVLFFLILFLSSLEMARVLPMIDKATRPGVIIYYFVKLTEDYLREEMFL